MEYEEYIIFRQTTDESGSLFAPPPSLRPKALYRLAQAHEGQGESNSAMRALEQLLKLDPNNREARARLRMLQEAERERKIVWGGISTKGGLGAVDASTAMPTWMPTKPDFLEERISSMLKAEARKEYEKKAREAKDYMPSLAEAVAMARKAEQVQRVRNMQEETEREAAAGWKKSQ